MKRYELTQEEMKLVDKGEYLKVRDMICQRYPELRAREAEDLIDDYLMLQQEIDHQLEYGKDS